MMKTIIFSLITIFTLASFSSAASVCSDCDKLKQIKSELSQKIRRNEKQNHALVMKSVEVMERSIEGLEKKKKEAIITELVAVLGAINSVDNYHITAETVLPAYKKYKALFEKEINRLPTSQKKGVQESFKLILREEKKGNG